MAKKSKWFVVATEGATTDGRVINRVWIEQMARNYNPKTYGARLNLEHLKTVFYRENEPHAKAYGDVLALKAEENAEGKLQLLAQIDPTDELLALNKARQKIYTSVEIDTNFADTGEAYLVGLAVTDNPASLSTEMLQFAAGAQANPLKARKLKPDNLFSAAEETTLDFNEESENKESLLAKIQQLFSRKAKDEGEQFADIHQSVQFLAESVCNAEKQIEALNAENAKLRQALTACQTQIETLCAQSAPHTPRPQATGGNAHPDFTF